MPVEKTITTTVPATAPSFGSYFGVRQPKLLAGKVILPFHMKPNYYQTIVMTASDYFFAPFYLPGGETYAGAAFQNMLTTDTGKKVKIAFYSEATNGGPGALAKDFGEFTLTNPPLSASSRVLGHRRRAGTMGRSRRIRLQR